MIDVLPEPRGPIKTLRPRENVRSSPLRKPSSTWIRLITAASPEEYTTCVPRRIHMGPHHWRGSTFAARGGSTAPASRHPELRHRALHDRALEEIRIQRSVQARRVLEGE